MLITSPLNEGGRDKKDLRKSKAGTVTVYMKCVNSSCVAPNRLIDGLLFDKQHKGHSCTPDPTLFEKLDTYTTFKHKAATSDKAPSKIINEGLYCMSEEGRIGTKSVHAMRQKIQRERRKGKGKGKMPRSIKDIDVKVESTILPGNINFLLYDNKKDDHRILIFCDFEGLLWLGNSEEWDSDGTFDAVPGTLTELFAQLYVFHGLVDGVKFPLAFCLMEKREAIDYIEILQVLKQKMAEFGTEEDPFIVRVNHGGVTNADLEVAIQIAESQELPGADQRKCIFHISQMSNKQVCTYLNLFSNRF